MKQDDQILAWLNDAYMMEKSVEEVLLKHVMEFREFPEWRDRLQVHVEETADHAAQVRKCIEELGGAPSTVKSLAGEVMGKVQGLTMSMFADKTVKAALAEYASEHLEIASYTALVAAAEEAGYSRVAEVCRGILAQEEAMAGFIIERLPILTRHHLEAQTTAV
jgi:ferritin-like metal-binding protein YciE